MKANEIIKILNEHKIEPTETWITSDVILETDFELITDKLLKLFYKPDFRVFTEQDMDNAYDKGFKDAMVK